jgi:MFS transporter, ACS family, glucarate transporter
MIAHLHPTAPAIRIRWRIFSFLFGFGFLAYLQQKTITVAAEPMMPALGLTHAEIARIETAFIVGYALFQMPGGVFGQRVGARAVFVIIGLIAFAATLATPLVPAVAGGMSLFVGLMAAQFVLGVSQAPIFPLSAGVFEAWFPPKRWATVQGLQTMGLNLGAALTPPLIVALTHLLGWQRALVWASLPALALIALWSWYGRNSPREHPGISAQELDEIGSQPAAHSTIGWRQILPLLRDRSVLLLFVSYLCMNYTFYLLSNWVFLYLVEERHFSSLEGSWLASVPPLAAAAGAGIGGILTGFLIPRLGSRWGYRSVPLVAILLSGLLLLLAVNVSNPYLAVAALATCFGVIELSEGAFWGAGMTVGSADSMAVCGFMNTGGNLGGIIGTPIVGMLVDAHAWHLVFVIGVVFAIASAIAWLGIDVAEPAAEPPGDAAAQGAGA